MSDQNDAIVERFPLTRTGYEYLRRELEAMKVQQVERQEQMFDLQSDGLSDYHDDDGTELSAFFEVKTSKERIDERVAHLEYVLNRAELLEDEDPNPRRVDPGEVVTLYDYSAGEEVHYRLLNTAEVAHGMEGVSVESPVGQALIGRRVGDVVEVQVPDGVARYAVRRIERPADT